MKTVEKLLLVRIAMLDDSRVAAMETAEREALEFLLAKGKEDDQGVSPRTWSEESGITHKVFRLSLAGLEEIQKARTAAVDVLGLCLINANGDGTFGVNQLPDKFKSLDDALAYVGLKINSLA